VGVISIFGMLVQFLAEARDFSLLSSIQTGPGAHPASCPMNTGALYKGLKLTTHLHLVSRSRIVDLYLHFHVYLHGKVLK
jgi:hypothetical protein